MVVLVLVVFYVSLAAIAYTYVGYPLTLLIASQFVATRSNPTRKRLTEWPSVTMVVAVHNEESVIEQKVTNTTAIDYPDRFDCLFVSDSDDGTGDILREAMPDCMTLLTLPERRGKSYALNRALERVDSDVVVFSDANTMYEPDAVTALVNPLSDERVGCVTGRLRLLDADGETAESAYWRYETWLRRLESRLGTTVSVNGGVLALHRASLSPLPEDALVDDLELALDRLRADQRVHYAPDAIATEHTTGAIGDEFARRVRIGAGNVRALGRYASVLNPRRGRVALEFFSHKVLRWLVPWLLAVVAVATLALVALEPSRWSLVLLGTQALGYGAAIVGLASDRAAESWVFRVPAFFVAMNAALAVGWARALGRQTTDVWTDTVRQQ